MAQLRPEVDIVKARRFTIGQKPAVRETVAHANPMISASNGVPDY
eukprot:XP_001708586.1 Hypothetical protein GL50803_21432 [Giardia lamblia ATCC 50803]